MSSEAQRAGDLHEGKTHDWTLRPPRHYPQTGGQLVAGSNLKEEKQL